MKKVRRVEYVSVNGVDDLVDQSTKLIWDMCDEKFGKGNWKMGEVEPLKLGFRAHFVFFRGGKMHSGHIDLEPDRTHLNN